MWIAQSPKPQLRTQSLYRHTMRIAAVVLVCGATACSAPVFPDNTPTKAEVPFLGSQLTQTEIATWAAQIAQQRQNHAQQWANAKRACYQRFFVNSCLQKALEIHRTQSAVLRKQDIELNRQRRFLQEIDRQLRLKANQSKLSKR